ncbi:MAG: hypothetical protein HRT74_09895 [Flavobacteriales bacterium]|nr:hypothetical protein [Flavobacteriales bacterium]
MDSLLKKYWNNYVEPYFNDADQSAQEFKWIYNQHTKSNRFYHGLGHLKFLLTSFEEVKTELISPHLVVIAIFYHDSIYNALKKNNEEKSATKAVDTFSVGSMNASDIEKLRYIILATKSHEESEDPDINIFVDMDLAILGSSEIEYEKYCLGVRKEYSIFPEFMYKKGRREVLNYFLAKEEIFKSEYFKTQYEKNAKVNLTKELKQLEN